MSTFVVTSTKLDDADGGPGQYLKCKISGLVSILGKIGFSTLHKAYEADSSCCKSKIKE